MPRRDEIAEGLYKKLKSYENPKIPLSHGSTYIEGDCGSLQKILDLLEDLPKIPETELKIERPDFSQLGGLETSASGIFKRRTAKYLFQWGFKFKYKINVPHNLYEALVNYVDKHGIVNEQG